jgi:hypothetical protein
MLNFKGGKGPILNFGGLFPFFPGPVFSGTLSRPPVSNRDELPLQGAAGHRPGRHAGDLAVTAPDLSA